MPEAKAPPRGARVPQPALRWVLWVTAALALVGGGLSLLVFRTVQHGEIARAEKDFVERVDHQYGAVRENLRLYDVVLQGLASFAQGAGPLDQERFAAYAAPLVAGVPGIQALEWIPAVPRDERAAFERDVAAAEFPGYAVVERDPAGNQVPVAGRDTYYPVRCVFPLETNRPALGFDLGSEPVRRTAMLRAAETGQPSATAPVRLLQEKGTQGAWLVFVPVWGPAQAGVRDHRLTGFVLGAFRAGDVIGSALRQVPGTPLPLAINDRDAPEAGRLFGPDVDALLAQGGLSRDLDIGVGGRLWQVRIVSPRLARASTASWLALAGSALLTWLVCALFMMLVRGRAIAERLVAERTAELLETRDRERRLFIGGPVVVFRWRAGGDWPVEYVTPNVRALVGVDPADLTSGRVAYVELIHPDDRDAALQNAQRLAAAGLAGFQQAYRLRTPDGRTLHVLDFTVLVRDAAGVVTHHEGYLLDVSEREEVRRQLEASKQQLDLAIAGANLGIWDWDVATGAVTFSDGFAAMLGYGPGELAPHVDTWRDLVHPDDMPQVMVVLQAHLDGATQQYETEHRLRHRDGHWIWVLDRGRVLRRDEQGRPLHAAGTHLDITEMRRVAERYQAGLALRERTSQALARCSSFEEIAEVAQEMMGDAARFVAAAGSFVVRLDAGDESLRVINAWASGPTAAGDAARVWALCGQFSSWWPLTENLREPQLMDVKRLALPVPMQDYLRDLGARSIVMMVVPVGPGVRYLVAFAARRLVTAWEAPDAEFLRVMREAFAFAQQRVELNRQNEQTRRQLVVALDRAEQANKVKITFLARMSHEIRTPMTAIVGLADVLRRSRTDLDDKTRAWLEQIHRNADHLIALLNDLLDLSKIDAGELQVASGPVPMHDLLDSVESTLLPKAQEKGLELRVTCDPDLPAVILSDRLRLRQILLNLGANAVKFTDHGRVDIAAALEPGGGPPVLSLVVRDTGVGIAADQLELIFQPFMQSPGEDLAARGGTGLGLDISRRLARALGGDVTVVSQPGLGSAFTLRLPLTPCEEHVTAAAHARVVAASPELADERLRGRRILVVDDNPDNREVVSYYLVEAGAIVVTAVDGADGVRRVQAAVADGNPYDAVLMDMRMPVLNGYRATLALRRAGILTPVIALTAHAMEGDERACLNAGCNAYVSKPIEPLTLVATVAAQVAPGVEDEALPPEPVREAKPVAASEAPASAPAAPAVEMPRPGGMLSGLAGDARFLPLLLRYLDGLPEQVAALAAAREAGDRKGVIDLVHRVHGTGTSFGYPAISEVSGACERELRAGGTLAAAGDDLDELARLMSGAAAGRDAIAAIGGRP